MIVDLHSHYLPPESADAADLPIAIEPLPDGERRFAALGHEMTLEAELFDLERQRAALRRQGLERRILAPPPFSVLYELPAAQGARWSGAVNEGIAEAARVFPDEFVGFATLPLQDVAVALMELERAAGALGLRGVEILTHIAGVELDDPLLDPFWTRAEQLRLPILVHPHQPAGSARMGDYYLRNLVGNPVETALAGARLLFGGVLERFPGLVIILSHGGGALPGIAGRLTHGDHVRSETRVHTSAPLDGLRRLYYDTIVFDPQLLRSLVAQAGASQVVLGTDYPFDMGEESPVEFVRGAGLSAVDTETVLSNGARLLGV